ncbi:MAG TPA: helix-turn-helix transcriptional regulator [Chlamydiales bacterium]|nr:helix-turn-helix transcriptional regulator [Chlamydiales bacterium]
MSVHTRTRHTKSRRVQPKVARRKKRTPWREVAKKEIRQYSEGGLMLRGCRYKKGVTQLELSEEIGVNQHHISEMENGKRPIGKEMARRLAEFFKTDYRVFL